MNIKYDPKTEDIAPCKNKSNCVGDGWIVFAKTDAFFIGFECDACIREEYNRRIREFN